MKDIEESVENFHLSSFEYKYSIRCLNRLGEKLISLRKVVDEIDNIFIKAKEDLDFNWVFRTNGTITEAAKIVKKLSEIEESYFTCASKMNASEEEMNVVINLGVTSVKLVGTMNTLLTKLQLQVRKEVFIVMVENEIVTTLEYLIDYGRTLLLEIIS